MTKLLRVAVKYAVIIACYLGLIASSSKVYRKAVPTCPVSQTSNNAKRECDAAFPGLFLNAAKAMSDGYRKELNVHNRTSPQRVPLTCGQTLAYMAKHHTNFASQSNNLISHLPAHVRRLKDVWTRSFEDCLSLRFSVPSDDSQTTVQGQYCIAYFLPPSLHQMSEDERYLFEGKKEASRYPIPIPQTGLCTPGSCSAVDVQDYLKFLLKESASNYTIFVPQDYCQTDKPKPVSLFTKIVVVAVMTILFLAVVGTFFEVSDFLRKSSTKKSRGKASGSNKAVIEIKESFPRSIAKCFSLFSNSWYLFKMDMGMPGEIDSFNGAKFIMAVGCQVIHVVAIANHNGWHNSGNGTFLHNLTVRGFFYIQLLLQSAVAMSGTGIAISTLHRIQNKKEEFKLIPFYLRRLWRLSIPYYIELALVIGVVPYLGSGPKWPDVERTANTCKNYWWSNVFYLNNYISDPLCQFQTWYLAADAQLLLIAPLFILAFNRSAFVGLTLVSVFITLSISKIFYHAYYDSLNAWDVSIDPLVSKTMRYFRQLYFLPYSRIGCYCAGITFGYIVHTYGKAIPLPKAIHRWISAVAATFVLSPFWLWYRYESSNFPAPSCLEAALCEACSRIFFTSASIYMCMSIYAECQDSVTKGFRIVFCNKFFVFTSKLHYSVFLLHVIVIEVFLGTRPQPMEYSTLNYLTVVFGLLVLTYLIAIPFTLLAVFPFTRMERIIEEKFESKWKNYQLDKHN